MNVLIAGDFCQKYRVDDAIKSKRFNDLFDEIKPVVEDADYSIVNFEFPIVLDSTRAIPIQKCGPNLKGTIEAVDAIKYAGFNCCTLANNHILDQGEQCCLDTKNQLENATIDTVGVGENLEESGKTLYKKINGEILAIINCCEHEFSIATDTSAGANPLNPISQYYKIQEARKNADYVLVIVHGGHEHFQLPSLRMQETYRFFIDAGADAVVNHHQHCYSGYEVYKEKLIFYGLGNFLFDHLKKRNCIWNEGYMVSINFRKDTETDFRLFPYEQCKDTETIRLIKQIDSFESILNKINNIIIDKNKLRESIEAYYEECINVEKNIFTPYSNRILKKMYSLHMLPFLYTNDQIVRIWNHTECESHRDKLNYAFPKILRN
ncbi:MAG: CapA family protein [Paludibacteraceae bacterium]|nr:CapA family protein [Paludibacteraceae bacterium]